MAKIPTTLNLSVPTTPFDQILYKKMQEFMLTLSSIINAGITFSDNVNCQIVSVSDTGSANTNKSVSHTLKVIPSGYIVVKNSLAGPVYDGTASWTTSAISIRHTQANAAVTLIIFK